MELLRRPSAMLTAAIAAAAGGSGSNSVAKKPLSKKLAMVQPTLSAPVVFCGKKFVFAGPLFLYCSMSFIAAYTDVCCVIKYGVYVTVSTGNLITGTIAASHGKAYLAFLCLIMILANTFVGGTLSNHCMEKTRNRWEALLVLSIMSSISYIFADIATLGDWTSNSFSAILIASTGGALLHWIMKTGFVTAFMTVNLLKLTEVLYRLVSNISQGGAKTRGDTLTIVLMLFSFILGGFAANAALKRRNRFVLSPIILVHIVQVIHYKWWIIAKEQPAQQRRQSQLAADGSNNNRRKSAEGKQLPRASAIPVPIKDGAADTSSDTGKNDIEAGNAHQNGRQELDNGKSFELVNVRRGTVISTDSVNPLQDGNSGDKAIRRATTVVPFASQQQPIVNDVAQEDDDYNGYDDYEEEEDPEMITMEHDERMNMTLTSVMMPAEIEDMRATMVHRLSDIQELDDDNIGRQSYSRRRDRVRSVRLVHRTTLTSDNSNSGTNNNDEIAVDQV